MISAVLFDMDGTLLDIDLDRFLREYFGLLGPVLGGLLTDGVDPSHGLAAVMSGTEAMAESHPGRTNREVFNERFHALTGLDLDQPEAAAAIAAFYMETFPTLQRGQGPREGAGSVLATARGLGLKTALATNPIFPRAAIDERARWAGMETSSFDEVTSYENMYACKPHPDYYRQIARTLGVAPEECVMVGDDALLDLAAADIGMKTFYVGSVETVSADWRGNLLDLADLLPRLVSDRS